MNYLNTIATLEIKLGLFSCAEWQDMKPIERWKTLHYYETQIYLIFYDIKIKMRNLVDLIKNFDMKMLLHMTLCFLPG